MIKIAQQMCPEGVWGPRLRNKSEKYVCGPTGPYICLTCFAQSRPPDPPADTFCAISEYIYILHVFTGLAGPWLPPPYKTKQRVGRGMGRVAPPGPCFCTSDLAVALRTSSPWIGSPLGPSKGFLGFVLGGR